MTENNSSPPQKGRIFIFYQPDEIALAMLDLSTTGHLVRILVRKQYLWMSIRLRVDLVFLKFWKMLCRGVILYLALIGKQWLDSKDKGGKRRLDNPEDFVRIEIATALKRNIGVIPVLVDGVEIPRSTELPENLKALAQKKCFTG